MKVRLMFAWYDLYVGVFIDRPKRRVYIFPLPCLGVVIELARFWPPLRPLIHQPEGATYARREDS